MRVIGTLALLTIGSLVAVNGCSSSNFTGNAVKQGAAAGTGANPAGSPNSPGTPGTPGTPSGPGGAGGPGNGSGPGNGNGPGGANGKNKSGGPGNGSGQPGTGSPQAASGPALGTVGSGAGTDAQTDAGGTIAAASAAALAMDNGAFSCTPGQQGLAALVYQLPENTAALPDFTTMTPVGQLSSPELNVPTRDFTEGFPGVPNLTAWFGIDFWASLNVPSTGSYMFETNSDDGSKLFIDGQLVVNNDGVHSTTLVQSQPVTLTQGPHVLHIPYYQGPPTSIALQVSWQTPGSGDFEIIPATVLTHGTACNVTNLGTFQ